MRGPGIKRLYYSASDICFLVGIKTHTLKSWEEKFGHPKSSRSKSGRRLYKPKELEMAKKIKKLLDAGYSEEKISYVLKRGIPEGLLDPAEQPAGSNNQVKIIQEISDGLKDIMKELNESPSDQSKPTG